mmetsp:Transcript_128493/g.363658  ORF Transcript_128493/g.363658 Transcript_128493/m.363658 type:complete len:249 (-) Transcript_128493:207-953(-)
MLEVPRGTQGQQQLVVSEAADVRLDPRLRGDVVVPSVAGEAHEALPRPHGVREVHLRQQLGSAVASGLQKVATPETMPPRLVDVGREVAGGQRVEVLVAEVEQLAEVQGGLPGRAHDADDAGERVRPAVRDLGGHRRDHVAQGQPQAQVDERLAEVGDVLPGRATDQLQAVVHQGLHLGRHHGAAGSPLPELLDARLYSLQLGAGRCGTPRWCNCLWEAREAYWVGARRRVQHGEPTRVATASDGAGL